MKENRKLSQFGRSMIEVLGVLAVVGVLSVGGIYGYSAAMRKIRLNNLRSTISHVVMGVRQYYTSQGSYEGLDTQTAIKTGIIPDDLIVESASPDGKTAVNIYNGDFLIKATIDPVDEKPLFMVVLTNIPKTDAVELGASNWDDDDSFEMVELQNNSDEPEEESEQENGE